MWYQADRAIAQDQLFKAKYGKSLPSINNNNNSKMPIRKFRKRKFKKRRPRKNQMGYLNVTKNNRLKAVLPWAEDKTLVFTGATTSYNVYTMKFNNLYDPSTAAGAGHQAQFYD